MLEFLKNALKHGTPESSKRLIAVCGAACLCATTGFLALLIGWQVIRVRPVDSQLVVAFSASAGFTAGLVGVIQRKKDSTNG